MSRAQEIRDIYTEMLKDCAKAKNPMHSFVQNGDEACNFIKFCTDQREGKTSEIFFLEIGARLGGSFAFWGRVFRQYFNYVYGIAVDLPCQPHEGNHPEKLEKCLQLMGCPFSYTTIIGDSHKIETCDIASKILNGQKIDMLFIDGDHSQKGSQLDFDMYSPLVKKDGIIAFHDIVPAPDWPWVECHHTWNNVKNNYPRNRVFEFKYAGDKYGIGAIVV